MADTSLVVQLRTEKGKGAARKLRVAGRVPAVVYGRGKQSKPITLDPRALERLLLASDSGLNTLIELKIEGSQDRGESVVLVKELQRDPVRGAILHADLYEVDLEKTVEVEVPVHLVGRPRGVEMGGILDHLLREIEVECLPRAIPQSFEVDVSELDINDGIHVRDLPLPEGVELRTDADLPVVHVVPPTVEEEAPAEVAAEVPVEGAEAAPTEAEAGAETGGKEGAE